MPDYSVWSTTPATNATADGDINAAEGETPPNLNNTDRGIMAGVAMFIKDINGSLTLAGGTTAYTVSLNNTTVAAYYVGMKVCAKCNATNTGASTLNVNSISAAKITTDGSTDIAAGVMVSGSIYDFVCTDATVGASIFTIVNGTPALTATDITATAVTGYSGTDVQTLLTNIGAAALYAAPSGIISAYGGTSAPTGWLLCYGQAVSRTTYSALFTAIGTTHGVGDGSTTFNLPDLRGRAVAGLDNMGGSAASRLTSTYFGSAATTAGTANGSESNTLTSTTIPGHTHSFSATTSSDGAHTPAGTISLGDGTTAGLLTIPTGVASKAETATESLTGTAVPAHTHTVSGTSGSTGSGSAHANVQPTMVLNYIIKY